MRKPFLLFVFFCIANFATAQNVGINSTNPQATLDVNGDLILRNTALTLANGANENINTTTNKFSHYSIAGPTSVFEIGGLTGGIDGRTITLYNSSAFLMIIKHQSAGSAAANQIHTGMGADFTLSSFSSVSLRYQAVDNYWHILSSHNNVMSAGSGWSLSGNAGTTAANFIGTTDEQPLRFGVKGGSAGIVDSFRRNTGLGLAALRKNTTGGNNTALGSVALSNNTTGSWNTGSGVDALSKNITGSNNTANGSNALYNNTTGSYNTANGLIALYSNTTGSYNTANGTSALFWNTSGYSNIAIGASALYNNTDRSNLVAIGDSALYNNGIGAAPGQDATRNTAIGSKALFSNSTGSHNTANGYDALRNNTTGSRNTAFGENALSSNTSAHYNVAIGNNTLRNSTGQRNTAIGTEALFYHSTGSFNTALGDNAGALLPNNINHVTCIGIRAGFATTQSNNINIGDLNITWIGGQVNWSTYSDGRIKNNIQENVPGINFIKALRPVTYNLDIIKQDAIANEGAEKNMQKRLAEKKLQANGDAAALKQIEEETAHFASLKLDRAKPKYPEQFEIESIKQTGFIAQEVEAAAKKYGFDFNGVQAPKNGKGLYTLSYASFVVPLVKAVQEQQQQIELLVQQNQELLKRLEALEKKE